MATKNTAFTERLRKLIEDDLKMTHNAFADEAKIGRSTLGNYFNKQNYGRVPEWDQLIKISAASGKSVDWLLTGKETSESDAEHRKSKEIVDSIHQAQPALHGMLDVIVESDRSDAIIAVTSMLRGTLLMIGESSSNKELQRFIKLLERIVQLVESRIPPKKRPKKPAPDAGM